jgi:hypothetical protein
MVTDATRIKSPIAIGNAKHNAMNITNAKMKHTVMSSAL